VLQPEPVSFEKAAGVIASCAMSQQGRPRRQHRSVGLWSDPLLCLSAELQAGIQQLAQTPGVVVGAFHDQNSVVGDGIPLLHVHDPVVDFLLSARPGSTAADSTHPNRG
jgi:hypothetical protein